jgi:hypothetical protein
MFVCTNSVMPTPDTRRMISPTRNPKVTAW